MANEANDSDSGTSEESSLPRRSLMQGELIFEEGDVADSAYLILEGEVEIFRGDGAKQVGVATLSRGEIFGELSLIDGKPRAASARAICDSKMLIIRPEDMEARLEQLGETDKVLRRLMGIFVSRLRGQLDRLV